MTMSIYTKLGAMATVAVLSFGPTMAMAQETGTTLDVSGVTDYLGGTALTAVGGVGGAIILLAVAAMGFKWIKGMIFS